MATENNFVQAAIPRFDGHYDRWSMLMENFLRSKEYWPIIEDGIDTPAEGEVLSNAQKAELEAKKLKDLKAKNYLFQAIDRPILEIILCKETSKDIWDSMKKKYQGSSRVKRAQLQALRKDFETLEMKEGESVTNYCARTMEITNKMRFHGEKIGDVAIVEKILQSLTSKYNYVVCSIEESKDIDELSVDEVQSSLLVHEQKMNKSSGVQEQALKSSTNTYSSNYRGRGRGRGRGDCGGRGRGDRGARDFSRNYKTSTDQSQGRGRDHDKSKVECYRCHKFGHYASDCYTRLPNDKEKCESANFVENKEVETLLMAVHGGTKYESNIWYVDTGCSNHMCGSKFSFSSLDENFHSTVAFGDWSTVEVMGKCDIKIKTKNGFVETITNVLYVPDLKSNLLSAGQLQEKGYVITIKKGECEIYDPVRGAIAVVQMSSNRLFPLRIDSIQSCLMAEVKDSSLLWHFRYGHLSFGGLETLQQKNMVTGLPQITAPSKICEECVVGKQHRSQFPKEKSWRAKDVLELVHSDLCGPINPTSNGGKTIKALRDRGGEYCSKEFEEFCAKHGIRRELTAAYTPQKNGVSKRKNRTILNMVRSCY
ncbi:hypothetical protein KY289_013063 [Solanum tuberosum]|nr:hypothetical protein KY289_013063 [Solanum tuberosum]